MPYARIDEGIELYYELTGPDDGPVVIQFVGGLFGRHNFGFVNDGFRERGFRLLSFDARGYGASTSPREWYTIQGWADDGVKLLDALGLARVLVHGTSMGGMIAIAFTATHGDRVIATCADVAFAKPDVYRATLFRVWRRMAESMPWDEKIVCLDPALASLDRDMAEAFAKARTAATGPAATALASSQRAWLKERRETCDADRRYSCVKELYQRRITELTSLKPK